MLSTKWIGSAVAGTLRTGGSSALQRFPHPGLMVPPWKVHCRNHRRAAELRFRLARSTFRAPQRSRPHEALMAHES